MNQAGSRILRPPFVTLALSGALAWAAMPGTVYAQALCPGDRERGPESLCRVVLDVQTSPSAVLLGESFDTTIRTPFYCVREHFALHIALLLDETEGMSEDDVQAMRSAAKDFLRRLDLEHRENTLISILKLGADVERTCAFLDDTRRLERCIAADPATGQASIGEGLARAAVALAREGCDLPPRVVDSRQVLVIYSNGAKERGCADARRASAAASDKGILVVSVCVGRDCEERCMRSIASSPRYFFRARQIAQLGAIFEQIRHHIQNLLLKQAELAVQLPASMAYVPDSAEPVPDERSADGSTVTWRSSFWPRDGLTFTLQIQPRSVGRHVAPMRAQLRFRDNKNRTGVAEASAAAIVALEPELLPSVTLTATATPTNTATPTATPRPRIFLPRGVRLVEALP